MNQQEHGAGATLSVTRGNPTAEELAAVTALLGALAAAQPGPGQDEAAAQRVSRLRKRRALSTPRLPWTIGRR